MKVFSAIFVLIAATVAYSADGKTALPALEADLKARQLLWEQMRMLQQNWVYAWRVPTINGESAATQTARELVNLYNSRQIQWDIALEAIRTEDVFSGSFGRIRLVLRMEGIVYDPKHAWRGQAWFIGMFS